MRSVKKTPIAEVARRIVENSPSILDCMREGLINYAALARKIKPLVVEATGEKEVSLEAIKMALTRFSEKLREVEKSTRNRIGEVIAGSTLELREDVAILTVKQRPLMDKISELTKLTGFRFFQLTQGTETFSIVVDQRKIREVERLIGGENVLMVIKDQSALILVSPEEIIYVPGVIAFVSSILARNGINVTQVISCYKDTVFIVDAQDALKAYGVLKKLIAGFRK